jgi:hypothetical protein
MFAFSELQILLQSDTYFRNIDCTTAVAAPISFLGVT